MKLRINYGWLAFLLTIIGAAVYANRVNPTDRYGCRDMCKYWTEANCERCCRERRQDSTLCEYNCVIRKEYKPIDCSEYTLTGCKAKGGRK